MTHKLREVYVPSKDLGHHLLHHGTLIRARGRDLAVLADRESLVLTIRNGVAALRNTLLDRMLVREYVSRT